MRRNCFQLLRSEKGMAKGRSSLLSSLLNVLGVVNLWRRKQIGGE
jgi:hypothetical protein